MAPQVKKYSTFTTTELHELLRKLRNKDELSLMSREYMLNKREQLQQEYEERLTKMEHRREQEEADRIKRLIDMKIISPNEISDGRSPQKDVGRQDVDVSYSRSKKKSRRCSSPAIKETILDPVERYHKSVFVDPFGVLGVEVPKPVTVDTSDLDAVTATYTKTYQEETLQKMAESTNVKDLYKLAEEAVLRTPEGCKGQISAP